MKRICRFTPELLLVSYVLLFLWLKHPGREWDRVINSDGKGYYAYLTGTFIYHDLQYRFVESYENKYYPKDRSVFKEFRMPVDGRVINKCYPGVALAWLPFFLAAHAVSVLSGLPADGYAPFYQYAVAIAALFYFWLGCRLLFLLLAGIGKSRSMAAFVTIVIALGTNMIYYTLIEGSMSHIYSFFFITAFLYSLNRFSGDGKGKWFIIACLVLGIIILIRPVNVLVVLLVPAFLCLPSCFPLRPLWLKENLNRKGIRSLILGSVLFLAILSIIPFLNWLQTGKLFVWSYGDETFDFTNPHFFSLLFSFNRGWFIYTPVAFLAIFGFIGLCKRSRIACVSLFSFFILLIYGASCWWMWYYASKCGQRIFVDFYAPVAILLLYLLLSVRKRKYLETVLSILLVVLTGLNVLQLYQHVKWIFPPGYITREIYFDSFFTLRPVAKIHIPDKAIIHKKVFFNDMEKNRGWMNEGTVRDTLAYSGKWSSMITESQPYGTGLELGADTLFTGRNRMIRVTARVFSPGEKAGASIVADFRKEEKSISYEPFYLHEYAGKDRWVSVNCGFYVPRDLPAGSTLKVYFYDPPGAPPLFIDDLEVEFLTLEDIPEYRRVEGVVFPVSSEQ